MKQHLWKLIFALFAVGVIVGANAYYERTVSNPARDEKRAIFKEIGAGWTSKAVLDRAAKYPALRVYRRAEEIRISEPLRFGAINWVLIIDVQEPHVRSARIRLHDSDRFEPDAAPEDKLLAGE